MDIITFVPLPTCIFATLCSTTPADRDSYMADTVVFRRCACWIIKKQRELQEKMDWPVYPLWRREMCALSHSFETRALKGNACRLVISYSTRAAPQGHFAAPISVFGSAPYANCTAHA